jgi:hypothetical protein
MTAFLMAAVFLELLPNSSFAQLNFVRSTARATRSQLPVNNDSRYRPDAKGPRSLRDFLFVHIQDGHVARWATDSLYQLDRIVAHGTASAEDLNFP